ncbi:MAG: CDP-alcohol phosphatidyltransferase family protein [Muribaculaceae bacterium]|nr:CDP-alcohol phosphatidyltransferase family protein [Muribaculaceae bacterium]MDE6391812.1 CDP-alcohol phosphatidyltransferase family protein [Muribaculaceae bacterium]
MTDNSTDNTSGRGLKSSFKASLKSMDTEEHIDLYFYRPIGYAWAVLARRLGITPNAITIASIFLGVGAGICFYYDNIWINIAGALLLIWADSFDSADGQLARMTGQYSRVGRILDGVSGDLWFAAIYVAICLRENVTSEFFMAHHWVIWVMAIVTGLCHATQAAMADYYRQFHLYFLKGEQGSELDNADELSRKYRALTWRRDFWQKIVLMFYLNYTSGQEKRTPAMQRLRAALRRRYGNTVPQDFRDRFRAMSLPLMKYTNILSFNVRTIALFAAILLLRMPWLYFAFELTVLNILLVYMMARHERMCRKLTAEIDN